MLKGKKLLVTGPAGSIAFPMCRELARQNEVWGIGRLSDPAELARVEGIGVKAVRVDLAEAEFGALPDDFDYVLHLAAYVQGLDYDMAIKVSAEATGLLMTHCRKARAVLVMSTCGVYRANDDPWHVYKEDDPLGDPLSPSPMQPAYGISKNAQEAVARMCARQLNLPTIICRMNANYGVETHGHGMLGIHFDMIRAGRPITLRSDPQPYSPIHDDDMIEQLPVLLDAASVPATIVNWGGDEAVPVQEWCAYFGEALGVEPRIVVKPLPGAQPGVVADPAKRISITGPCRIDWREGARRIVESRLGTTASV
ncbi:MAG TPA: NAD(P)-dependent oxidoreductase [Novosphingobium sp.]|nr:NAD(P)-dependent oxidoreductase [Novosphingobium sp.]